MAAPKYYVVFIGRKTGVFDSWGKCYAYTHEYKGAKFKSYQTQQDAELAFRNFAPNLAGKAKPGPVSIPDYTEYICVDGACTVQTQQMEYRGLLMPDAEEIFHVGPMHGTSNIAEFLAIVHALAYCKQKGIALPIYSDSQIARSWVMGGKAKTNLDKTPQAAKVFELIQRAEAWLSSNQYSNKVIKWETKRRGQIPADFGRK